MNEPVTQPPATSRKLRRVGWVTKGKTLKMLIVGEFETLTDFAAKMAINPITLQRWINGQEYPSCESVAIMSKVLRKSPYTIVMAIGVGLERRFIKKVNRLNMRMEDAFPGSFTKVQYNAPDPSGRTREEKAHDEAGGHLEDS